MQNILITGGAGFIGSRLARALTAQHPSCRIWVLDNLHPQVHGADAPVPDLGANVTFPRRPARASRTTNPPAIAVPT